MPSPGIGFGDLAVFIAVLVVVAVFLAAVRSVLKRAEAPEVPVEGERIGLPKNHVRPGPDRSRPRSRPCAETGPSSIAFQQPFQLVE